MKTIFTTIIALTMFTFTSCKKEVEKETDKEADLEMEAPVVEVPAFEPFQVMAITHTVKNYNIWKKGFDEDEINRTDCGLTLRSLARGTDNPNKIYIFLNVADMQKAKDFITNPKLKTVMQKFGVISKPEINYVDVVRFEESPSEFKDRVRVSIKIKDFDSWLKVYDGEGAAIRLENGLVDRAISKNVDDPNMIYVTFAVSDMAKAKTYMKAPELKRLMTEAGVISNPIFDFFTNVE